MLLNETDIIERFFQRPCSDPAITRHIGDDSAVLTPTADTQLVVTTDCMVEGHHFVSQSPAHAVGYKLMAVNVSDLAAMGATPRWATLSLTLTSIDEDWLTSFSSGLFECADRYGVELVGGDLSAGEQNNMTVQLIGEIAHGQALFRNSAQLDDDIYISGEIGHAGAALSKLTQAEYDHTVLNECEMKALYYPLAQVQLGQGLCQLAHACIDISDGLLRELEIICQQSQLGAEINLEHITTSAELDTLEAIVQGDDYQLLFTAGSAMQTQIKQLAQKLGVAVSKIGHMTQKQQLIIKQYGRVMPSPHTPGYDHFGT